MIVIYTARVTNRIKYAFDFVFANYFGIGYEFIFDTSISKKSDIVYLNYSKKRVDGFFSIYQDDLLLEETIHEKKLFVSRIQEMPVFFQTTDYYDLQFDFFSAIFYLVTRYEEYLLHEKDEHDRYKSSNSILANPAFNFSPIVEIWLNFFKQELLKLNADLDFKKHQFEYQPTFDIDNAFQFLGRNWLKKPPNIFDKTCRNVLQKKQKDPYDTFNFIQNEIEKYKLDPVLFVLLSDEDENDSNVSPDSKILHTTVLSLAKYLVGIHPSYNASNAEKVKTEIEKLSEIIAQPITLSRQHFLKFKFPDTVYNLISNNIQKDYSLAYPDIIGFRAGYSREIIFFDLIKNITTDFVLQPTCWMDATYEYYQKHMTTDEIINNFSSFLYLLKKINGKLVLIFHNDLLAKENYQTIFKLINQFSTQEK